MTTDTPTTVDTLLTAAGLKPSPAEREAIAAMYELFRPGVDAMYALPEARYEVPALTFDADPPLEQW